MVINRTSMALLLGAVSFTTYLCASNPYGTHEAASKTAMQPQKATAPDDGWLDKVRTDIINNELTNDVVTYTIMPEWSDPLKKLLAENNHSLRDHILENVDAVCAQAAYSLQSVENVCYGLFILSELKVIDEQKANEYSMRVIERYKNDLWSELENISNVLQGASEERILRAITIAYFLGMSQHPKNVSLSEQIKEQYRQRSSSQAKIMLTEKASEEDRKGFGEQYVNGLYQQTRQEAEGTDHLRRPPNGNSEQDANIETHIRNHEITDRALIWLISWPRKVKALLTNNNNFLVKHIQANIDTVCGNSSQYSIQRIENACYGLLLLLNLDLIDKATSNRYATNLIELFGEDLKNEAEDLIRGTPGASDARAVKAIDIAKYLGMCQLPESKALSASICGRYHTYTMARDNKESEQKRREAEEAYEASLPGWKRYLRSLFVKKDEQSLDAGNVLIMHDEKPEALAKKPKKRTVLDEETSFREENASRFTITKSKLGKAIVACLAAAALYFGITHYQKRSQERKKAEQK